MLFTQGRDIAVNDADVVHRSQQVYFSYVLRVFITLNAVSFSHRCFLTFVALLLWKIDDYLHSIEIQINWMYSEFSSAVQEIIA